MRRQKTYKEALEFFEMSDNLQILATKAMVHSNGRKRLKEKGYLKEMGKRVAYYRVARKAIKKQEAVRKEHRYSEVSGNYYFCPCCRHIVLNSARYCSECGQKFI